MATTSPPTTGKGLDAPQKAWLTQYIGKNVPWEVKFKVDGADVDAKALYLEFQADEDLIEEKRGRNEDVDPALLEKVNKNRDLLAKVGFPSVLERADEYALKREAKDNALTELRNMIDLQKDEIRADTDVEYKVKNKILGSKTVKAKIKKGERKGLTKSKEDAQGELEYDEKHYANRVISGPTPTQQKALNLVIAQLTALTERMREMQEGDAPLFSPNELMEEIWTPLVREQLVSEAQCPDEFSRVLKLWEGANKLYQERCKALARKEEDKFQGAREYLEDADELLGIGAGVVDIVLSVVGTGAKSKEILKLASTCARAGVQLTCKALEKDYAGAAGKIGDILAAAVPAPWNTVAKGSYLACVNVGAMAKKLSEKDADSAFDLFATAVGNALSAIGAGTDEDLFERVGKHAIGGAKTLYAAWKIKGLITDPNADPKLVFQQIGKITALVSQSAIAEALNEKSKQESDELEKKLKKEGKTKEEIKESLKGLKKEQEELATGFDGVAGSLGEDSDDSAKPGIYGKLGDLMQKKGLLPPDPAAVEAKAIEAGAKAMNEELDNAQALFGRQMASAFGVTVGGDSVEDKAQLEEIYDIDTIIAQVQADQAQIALLNAVLDAIGGAIALLVPQLGGAVKAKQFAMNVIAAVRRSQELLKFTNLLTDARKATSPQAYVLITQVDELKHQLTNDTITAALNLGQAIALSTAAAAELSGLGAAAAGAAEAVNAGLEVAQQAKDFLYKKFKDRKVKRAWANFKAALADPTNRRKVIKSFRQNPTLAKYAMAYGALEMGDAIAKESLRQCGLNDMVLAQEKTNAEKVVTYLEVKFSDDIQVTGVVSKFAPSSGDPLTFASWHANKQSAKIADGVTTWKEEPTPAIDGTLAAVEKATAAVGDGNLETAANFTLWETQKQSYKTLSVVLMTYKPKTNGNTPFKQFENYLAEMSLAAEQQAATVQEVIDGEREVRRATKLIHTQAATIAKEVVTAIQTAKPLLGAPTGREPDDVLAYFQSGGGKTVLGVAKQKGQQASAVYEATDLLEQAAKISEKTAALAKRQKDGGDTAKAEENVQKAVTKFATALNEAETALNTVALQSQTKADAITVVV